MMADYAWRESQAEEIDAALRAAVAASAHFLHGNLVFLHGNLVANEDEIRDRIAAFMRGVLDDITIAEDDVVADHEYSTNRATIGHGPCRADTTAGRARRSARMGGPMSWSVSETARL